MFTLRILYLHYGFYIYITDFIFTLRILYLHYGFYIYIPCHLAIYLFSVRANSAEGVQESQVSEVRYQEGLQRPVVPPDTRAGGFLPPPLHRRTQNKTYRGGHSHRHPLEKVRALLL